MTQSAIWVDCSIAAGAAEHCVVLTGLNRARFQCCSPAWSLSRLHHDLPALAWQHTLVFEESLHEVVARIGIENC